jgi:hypothetical protein
MSKRTAGPSILALGALALVGVTACAHGTKPDGMSVAAHEQQANVETAQAQTEVARATQGAPPLPVPSPMATPLANPDGFTYPVDTYNPAADHLARARQLEEHAHEHRAAAAKLETFVQDECRGFPPETRASCPMLGPVEQIRDIPNGVRVAFRPKTRVDAVAAHMRCHFAYAQAYGFDTVADCPLYVKGLQIRVSDDGKAIELTSREPRTIDVIRARTREEATLVRQ